MGSIFNFNLFATNFSIRGSTLAKVPTAPDIAQVDISFMALSKRS